MTSKAVTPKTVTPKTVTPKTVTPKTAAAAQASGADAAATFAGFPLAALDFYEDLEDDNSRTFWLAHKDTYDTAVKRPMESLTARLAAEFGAAKLFRPYRDIRFAKDKTPYKTHQGAVLGSAHGALYVQIGAAGLFVAGGSWSLAPDQVHRLRAAVAHDISGRALERVLARIRDAGLTLGGEQVTRIPSGYPRDHPRADLLRHKAISAGRDFRAPDWLGTGQVADEVAAVWRTVGPLNAWLDKYVGAADRPRR